ncbi:MAG TPA: cytochrome c oxidase assembly factor Coa1 family protein [Thermoanaerobaculia bacterium]
MTIDYGHPLGPAPPPQRDQTGCGTIVAVGCAVVLAIVILTIAVVTTFSFRLAKSSEVYRQALQRAANDPQVIALLGSPVEARWWVSGGLQFSRGEGGRAHFTIPLEGPKGRARLHVRAVREQAKWRFTMLEVRPENGGARIELSP